MTPRPPFPAPPMPELAPERVATASIPMRYEDIAQDGRMMMTALPPAIGWTVWRQLLADHPSARSMQRQGLVAILSRLTVDGTDEPIHLGQRLEATGGYQLARHEVDGNVEKLFLNMWVEVRGARGRMVPPEGPGEYTVAGRVFAEHTFTRIFAARGDRKVTRLDLEGIPPVPDATYDFPPPQSAMELPFVAEALEDDYTPDDAVTVFGLDHTDSNQHVNSLVYPRLFAEAAFRRFAARGKARRALVRSLDIAYRKPSFAGDGVRVHLRTFTIGDRVGAAGFLVDADDPTLRPRCCARIVLG
jgi:hypothetical protein